MPSKQHIIDATFQIASTMYRNREWLDTLSHAQLMEWVAKQFENVGIPTVPCGASWGVLIKS